MDVHPDDLKAISRLAAVDISMALNTIPPQDRAIWLRISKSLVAAIPDKPTPRPKSKPPPKALVTANSQQSREVNTLMRGFANIRQNVETNMRTWASEHGQILVADEFDDKTSADMVTDKSTGMIRSTRSDSL